MVALGLAVCSGAGAAQAVSYDPITGTGWTWSQNALDQWRKNVASNYGMTVNYSGVGFSAGRRDFVAGSVDFAGFADVDATSPFFADIQWMFTTKLSTGSPQSVGKPLYRPSVAVSREAMATFLMRLSKESFVPPLTPSFADVDPSSQFYTTIEWMASKHISTGTVQPSGKPLFNPGNSVSREAMALFLARYNGVDVSGAPSAPSFADVPATGFGAAAIVWMANTGISTGSVQPTGLPLYKPRELVSRQAMAAFLNRLAHL